MLHLTSNYRELEREADRLEALPDVKSKPALDAVLSAGFKLTQGAVHIQTGSLKSSGKKASLIHGDTWEGVISYGGVSAGVNNPVDYAIYEKRREGSHDFFSPLKALDGLWIKAMLRTLAK